MPVQTGANLVELQIDRRRNAAGVVLGLAQIGVAPLKIERHVLCCHELNTGAGGPTHMRLRIGRCQIGRIARRACKSHTSRHVRHERTAVEAQSPTERANPVNVLRDADSITRLSLIHI